MYLPPEAIANHDASTWRRDAMMAISGLPADPSVLEPFLPSPMVHGLGNANPPPFPNEQKPG